MRALGVFGPLPSSVYNVFQKKTGGGVEHGGKPRMELLKMDPCITLKMPITVLEKDLSAFTFSADNVLVILPFSLIC